MVETMEERCLLSAHHASVHHYAVATPAVSTRSARARARAAARSSPASAIAYSGPIVITKGGTYSGNWQSLDANVPAVEIRTNEPVIILNSNIRSRGTLIDAMDGADFSVNLTVRNTSGYGLNPNIRGQQGGRFIDVFGFSNIDVENNYLESTCGIYIEKYTGDHTANQTFRVLDNSAKNIDGRLSDGAGWYLKTPGDHYVQFFQTNGLHNMVGAEVAWNQVVNQPGLSLVEDNISIFDTTGTRRNPVMIHDNYIDGAYAIDAAHETDFTGGGIMLSDIGSAFVTAYNNQVIDTTNYGIAISSGHDNTFYNNRIVSSGRLANGALVAAQNVGAYIWNQNSESHFTNNVGYGNVISWEGQQGMNDSWVPDAASWRKNAESSTDETVAMTQGEWTLWVNKLAGAGVKVGLAA
jgi:parallel beta-helix repeat protein